MGSNPSQSFNLGIGTATTTSLTAGQVIYADSPSTVAGAASLYYDATNGRLGIGTTSPVARLSIVGTQTTLSGSSNPYGTYIYTDATGLGHYDVLTNSTGNTSFHLRTYNNGTYYTIIYGSNAGKVGMGVTNPSEVLQVAGNLYLGTTSTNDHTIYSGTSKESYIVLRNSSTGFMGFTNPFGYSFSGSNMGVGLTNPMSIFQAGDNTNRGGFEPRNDGVNIGGVGASNYARVGGWYSTNPIPGAAIGFPAQGGSGQRGAISFLTKVVDDDTTQPSVKAVLTGAGALGIGTTNPSSLLDVNGDVTVRSNLIIEKTSGLGIKVDATTPTFPYADLLGRISVRGVGATDPTFAVYRNGLRQFQYTVNDESFVEFHIPHDYAPGTDVYIHAHWSHAATTVTGGSVTWGLELTYAKGHNQAAFPATVTNTVVSNASTTQYQHMLTDSQVSAASPAASQIATGNLEPDGLIMLRVYLSANNMTVSGGGVPEPFLHQIDLHYQTTNIGTKNKSPNFYS